MNYSKEFFVKRIFYGFLTASFLFFSQIIFSSTPTHRFSVLESRFGCLLEKKVDEHQKIQNLISQCQAFPDQCKTTYDCSNTKDNLEGVLFSEHRDLSQTKFGNASVHQSLKKVSFANQIICNHCDFTNILADNTTSFARVPLHCAKFQNSSLRQTSFTGNGDEVFKKMPTTQYLNCLSPTEKTNFENADLSYTSFTDTILDNTVNFHCANLNSTSFSYSILKNIAFDSCDGKNLKGISFYNAVLTNIDISGPMPSANFESAELTQVNFLSDFNSTNFNHANLSDVSFGQQGLPPKDTTKIFATGVMFQGTIEKKTVVNNVHFYGLEIHFIGLNMSNLTGSSKSFSPFYEEASFVTTTGRIDFGNTANHASTQVIQLNGILAGQLNVEFFIHEDDLGTLNLKDFNCSQVTLGSHFLIHVPNLNLLKWHGNFSVSDSCQNYISNQ